MMKPVSDRPLSRGAGRTSSQFSCVTPFRLRSLSRLTFRSQNERGQLLALEGPEIGFHHGFVMSRGSPRRRPIAHGEARVPRILRQRLGANQLGLIRTYRAAGRVKAASGLAAAVARGRRGRAAAGQPIPRALE
jgi:hypothetical protein